ncbi:MAG: hypothetical protein A2498_06670 [Lentisphaerae bacterium RIFOXYC12_FULL_60_16]|nr:MAG: hypothetical protein A2498_06670 [Lentisphaerae bacterium RIFOXYC12_FULL_60_16]
MALSILVLGAPFLFAGDLRIEVVTAYNLVVDSNVESPSTYAPRSAYLGAKIYNDGTNDLTDVYAYIGDYLGGTNDTPGIYPSRTHPPLVGPLPGSAFALTHEGGSDGALDATRYLGTLPAGQYITVYWLISYPNLDANGDAVWGPSIKPDDDLYLFYDIWATAGDAGTPITTDVTRKVTMRNEISAAANKILPNGANKVPDAYKELLQQYVPAWTNIYSDGTPGTRLWTEGIWYDLGNVGAGFDNDGDLVPDRNAWMQPVGDPSTFDASAFRLVKSSAMVVVKLKGGGEQVYVVDDQLYFVNIPENNGAVGLVRYEFLPLRPGISALSPYQEVASGFDNEKFNGDYGASGGTLVSGVSKVNFDKTVDRDVQSAGGTMHYALSFTNTGEIAVGDPSTRMPLVAQDAIPAGVVYVAGSAISSNVLPYGVTNYAVLYSTNAGLTWLNSEPIPASRVTHLQWWLSDAFQAACAGRVGFAVTVNDPYDQASPLILNTGGLSFGSTYPFTNDTAVTMVLGTNRIGDAVFQDIGTGGGILGNGLQDGSEAGISNIEVRLYFDANTNNLLDGPDQLMASKDTGANGSYRFDGLPDGRYLVAVNTLDGDLPFGYTATTQTLYAVDLDSGRTNAAMVSYLTADFGFAPVLGVSKRLVSSAPLREGGTVTYELSVTNRLKGNGGLTQYHVWATNQNAKTSGTVWNNATNAYRPAYPDGNYASIQPGGNKDILALDGLSRSSFIGNLTKVELLIPLRVDPPWNNDTLTIEFWTNGASTASFTTSGVASAFVTGDFTRNLTSLRTWLPAHFAAGNPMVIAVTGAKVGAVDGGTIGVDQMGLRVTTDWIAGSSNTALVLDPVPLMDWYNAERMSFLSAVPPVSTSVTNGSAPNRTGTLTWNNLGPLYPGGYKTVTATFNILEPPNNTATTVTNAAVVTAAKYKNGYPANTGTSLVATAVQPAGTIGDFVWRDLDGDGVQDGGNETGISGVSVVLRPPAGVDVGRGPGQPVTNVTDASGYYRFKGIPVTGSYTVLVVTATLPGGSGVCTFDRDGNNNGSTPVTIVYDSTTGQDTVLNADFGYQVSAIIQGTIWNDVNASASSVRNSGENWLTNVTVYLFAGTNAGPPGAALATNRTDRNGAFTFVGAYSGNYTLLVDTNSGMLAGSGWVQTYDSDGIGSLNVVRVSVVSGGSARGDFSYRRKGTYTIGDLLFYDWNGNKAQDAADEGVGAITVYLYEDENGNGSIDSGVDALIRTTASAAGGSYTFTELIAGNYQVIVDHSDPDMPPRYAVTADPQGANDGRSAVSITTSNRYDQDFGYQPYGVGSIGDTVWKDLNGDGLQAGSQETGLANITVRLYVDMNGDGAYVLLRTQVTDSAGRYLFADLSDAPYRALVDATDADLPLDAFGFRYVPTTATTRSIAISGGSNNLTADFGFAALGAIGDTIFWDSNENGTQDWTEPGISNVTVVLYRDLNGNRLYESGTDVLVTNALTDADGHYLFTGLTTGRYVVVVSKTGPIATATLSADPDADGLPASDPEAVGCDGQYGVRVNVGASFMGVDFGYVPPGVIGDTVWIDMDDNGIRDETESGIPFVTVNLYSNAVLIASTETDGDGYYTFANVGDGTWQIVTATNDADFPPDLAPVHDPDGTLDNRATDVVMSGGHVASIDGVSKTNADLTIDFGYRYAGNNALSGTIGLDGTPTNGVMGVGISGVSGDEVAFEGATVFLTFWDDDGDDLIEAGETRLIGSTLTSTNGDYSFAGLPTGSGNARYIVSLAAPESDLELTTQTGDTPATEVIEVSDSQGNTSSARQIVPVAASITNLDFAFRYRLNFDFGDLPSGYGVRFQDSPSGARHPVKSAPTVYLGATVDTEANGVPSEDAAGDGADEDGVASVGAWASGGTGEVQVTVGGGRGWVVGFVDFNQDGDFMDPGEMTVNQAVSGSGGSAVYTNRFAVPEATFSGTNATHLYARFRVFATPPMFPQFMYAGLGDYGEVEDYRWTFGAIGNDVWKDLNADGVQDAGEPPISGVRLFVDLDGDGVCQAWEPSALTDVNGRYGIGGLRAGTYTVRVDTNTLPLYLVASYDLDGLATLHHAAVAVTNGQVRTDVDFGYAPMAIGGVVWQDADMDGIQDELPLDGLSNIVVRLYDGGTNWIASALTGPDGSYRFDLASPGSYLIEFFPVGYLISPRDQGGDDAADSDVATNAPYRTVFTSILPGERDLQWDMGLYRPTYSNSVGNLVWFDGNRDGIQDPGEPGLAGITVGLYNASTTLVAQTVTDIEGYYYFAGIDPGSYRLFFDKPADYYFSPADMTGDTVDSDPATNTGFTALFTVVANTADNRWDAGLYGVLDLAVTKVVDNASPDPGDTVVFSITVTNQGPSIARSVQLTDAWPTNLTLVAAVPGTGTFNPTNRVWSVGTLPVGGAAAMSMTGTVHSGTVGKSITNRITITHLAEVDTNAANDTAYALVAVAGVDLGLGKSVNNANPYAGSNVVYTIVITNYGPKVATGVTVSEPLTNGLTYLSHTAFQGTYDSTTKVWSVGTLAVDETAMLQVTASVSAGMGGLTIVNRSRIAGVNQADTDPGNNSDTATVVVRGADLAISKRSDNLQPNIGSTIHYTLVVSNRGPNATTGVVANEPLTNGLGYVSHTATQGTYSYPGGDWNIGSLGVNSSATLQITVTVSPGMGIVWISNRTAITAQDLPDPVSSNNTAEVVVGISNMQITKTSNGGESVYPGSNITYTIVVTNDGVPPHYNVLVTDPLPAGVTYVAGSAQVTAPYTTNRYLLDRFVSAAFTNNQGTLGWSGGWQELNEADGAAAGKVRVTAEGTNVNTLLINGSAFGVVRGANLFGYYSARLSFDYKTSALEADDGVTVSVSTNGTAGPWTDVAAITGPSADANWHSVTDIDVSSHLTTNFALRFLSYHSGNNEIVYVDNVRIDAAQRLYRTAATNGPSTLVNLPLLREDEYIRVTYQVKLPTSPTILAITNRVSVHSDQMTFDRYATVTDHVHYADLEVLKDVDDTTPGTNEVVTYSIRVRNLGRNTATDVVLREYWPDSHVILSNAVVSRGSYDTAVMTNHVWTIGSVSNNETVTLTITGVLKEVSSAVDIVNRATITAMKQYDPNPSNNTDSISVITLVVLKRFEGGWDTTGPYLEWETVAESGTVGFYVERQDVSGRFEKVCSAMIPAVAGSPQGGIYRLYDPGARAGSNMYRLVELEMSGRRRLYGPYGVWLEVAGEGPGAPSVRYQTRPRISDSALERLSGSGDMLLDAPVVRLRVLTAGGSGGGPSFPPVKLLVRSNGMYRVTASSVAASLGVMESAVRNSIMAGQCAVSHAGNDVAVYRLGDGSAFWFYGAAIDSPFTDDNVYWIDWGMASDMVTRDGLAPSPLPGMTFESALQAEQDLVPVVGLARAPDSDYWMWSSLVVVTPSPVTQRVSVVLSDCATGGVARIQVQVYGASATGVDNEHHVQVRVNDVPVGSAQWQGVRSQAVSGSFNQSILHNGTNWITCVAYLNDGIDYSVVYLDSLDLAYRRGYGAESGQLHLAGETNPVVTVSGLSSTNDAFVFDVTDPVHPVRVLNTTLDLDGGKGRVSFVPATPTDRYVAGYAGWAPFDLKVRTPTNWKSPSNSVAYLVLTVPGLAASADALADYRRERGLPAAVALVEDWYDAFNHGIASPYAIQAGLRYAVSNWMRPPDYVVLAGKGTYDYKQRPGYGGCLVPPMMVMTPYGLFASDNRYADIDGDGLADLAIGRLPVLNPSEMQLVIDKIRRYEGMTRHPGNRQMVLSADRLDGEGDFRHTSRQSVQRLPADVTRVELFLDDQSLGECKSGLLAAINAGAGWVSYFGHAGFGFLANDGLLEDTDVPLMLNSNQLSIFTLMGCVTADFAVPGYDSLGESLLLNPGGGAVAVWGPSGWAANTLSGVLGRHLNNAVWEGEQRVLGNAIQESVYRFADERPTRYLTDIYTLLGDPALVLPGIAEGRYPYRSPVLTLEGWSQTVFTLAALTNSMVSDPTADPDEDGLVNHLEYVLGLNPLVADDFRPLHLEKVMPDETLPYDVVLVFTRRRGLQDYQVLIEVSDDLMIWTADPVHIVDTQVMDDGNGQTETVRIYAKAPDVNRRRGFVRLVVKETP